MIRLVFEGTNWSELQAELRTALLHMEDVVANSETQVGGPERHPSDVVERMKRLLKRLSPSALKLIHRHAQGRVAATELGRLVGGIPALRGVNSQISTCAKKCGLTYDELIVRDYQNYNSVGTEYTLSPTFQAVVDAELAEATA